MLVLGVTASILEPYRSPPGSPVAGVFVCYFVARPPGSPRGAAATEGPGSSRLIACGFALSIARGAFLGRPHRKHDARGPRTDLPPCRLCLLAGLLDLNAVLRRRLSPVQRISRHLWRMCFAFFIATGSFFLGQQKVIAGRRPRLAHPVRPGLRPICRDGPSGSCGCGSENGLGTALEGRRERPATALPGAGDPDRGLVEEAAE
jgi:hypothetical protein